MLRLLLFVDGNTVLSVFR